MAVAFKQKYPYAFRKYNAHCLTPPTGFIKQHQANIVGTTLLIPPPNAANRRQESKTPHYIACLFTSLDYGKRVSPPKEILENTRNALKDLAKQVAEIRDLGDEGIGKCYAVRINSGKFGVEWEKTKAVLEAGDLAITVVRPEGEEKAVAAGGKLEQPLMKGEKANWEKPRAETNTRGHNPRASNRAKAEIPFEKQVPGVKRKADEVMNAKEPAQLHPGIAKRRKKLCLDG